MPRKSYPSDVSDDEWAFAAPYLTPMREDAPQRRHDLRELFNGLRYAVRTGCQWRYLPGDLPPWEAVYQQARRWMAARAFSAMAADLRALLRLPDDRPERPTAAVIDSRTLQSTPESGGRGTGRLRLPPATTATSARRGRRSASPSTRSATCWPSS